MSYPGGKGNSFRHIINLMPPHEVYVETHLGGGSVFLHKRAAHISVLNDINDSVIAAARNWKPDRSGNRIQFTCCGAVDLLADLEITPSTLIYCDPPYLLSTRKSGRIYKYEYSRSAHAKLIDVIRKLNCMVIISGYPNALYDDALSGWNTYLFNAVTRAGSIATECLWFNYDLPRHLHDYSYVGSSFREREILKRQKQRWVQRLRKMDPLRRHSLLLAIGSAFQDEIHFLLKNNP